MAGQEGTFIRILALSDFFEVLVGIPDGADPLPTSATFPQKL